MSYAISKPVKGADGRWRFTVSYKATNGFGERFFDSIDASLSFIVDSDGRVSLDLKESAADTYPSLGVYSYRMVQGTDVVGYSFEVGESTPSALGGPMVPLAERKDRR